MLLGSDLTQADVEAEYSCIALDTPSATLKLTTDGENKLLGISLRFIKFRTKFILF